VIDTDIQSPGIHVPFGLDESRCEFSLNDYLWGKCAIEQAAHDVTPPPAVGSGCVQLIPSSIKAGEIARVLREGYDESRLNEGMHKAIEALKLDVLMIDTHPGLNEETLLSIAVSHTLLVVLRPDQQDYQGTGVTVDVARQLDVPRLLLLVNKVPAVFDTAEVRARVEHAYRADVAGVLPHSEEMMTLASSGLFVLRFPEHPITKTLSEVAAKLLA
jgi:MinD-like ATPase involved in chromosome partitioning or flagellar assembly